MAKQRTPLADFSAQEFLNSTSYNLIARDGETLTVESEGVTLSLDLTTDEILTDITSNIQAIIDKATTRINTRRDKDSNRRGILRAARQLDDLDIDNAGLAELRQLVKLLLLDKRAIRPNGRLKHPRQWIITQAPGDFDG